MPNDVLAPQEKTEVPGVDPLSPAGVSPVIPAGLEKFADDKGSVDVSKLGSSYLEVEKRLRQTETEAQRLRSSLEAINPPTSNVPVSRGDSSDEDIRKFAANPRAFVQDVLSEVSEPLATDLSKTALEMRHPEMKDAAFKNEIVSWIKLQPRAVQDLELTLEGADFLVNLYKRERGLKATSPSIPNTEIPAGGSVGSSGRTISMKAVRELMVRDPAEYSRRLPDIEKAVREGRTVA